MFRGREFIMDKPIIQQPSPSFGGFDAAQPDLAALGFRTTIATC